MGSFVLSLLLTLLVRYVAIKLHIVHVPTERCTHSSAMPRIGGLAIYLAFLISMFLILPIQEHFELQINNFQFRTLIIGASFVFLIGFIDDLYSLNPFFKLFGQIAIAIFSWYGGIKINTVSISMTSGLELGLFSLPISVFWIVLVINAINLFDGLDGLAAGVTIFVSTLMLIMCVMTDKLPVAFGFAALLGSVLGFLKFNFNPASIFMGDCGSYFLGYTIATLSILGTIKGQTTLAMLIPFISLGLPVFDALLSPVRRYFNGQKIFTPDQHHLHHRLLHSGLEHRTAVLVIYGMTLLLSVIAFFLIYARDELAALILLIAAIVLFLIFSNLGYFNELKNSKANRIIKILSIYKGFNLENLIFKKVITKMRSSTSIEEMWTVSGEMFEKIGLDSAFLQLDKKNNLKEQIFEEYVWTSSVNGKENINCEQSLYHNMQVDFLLRSPGNNLIDSKKKSLCFGRLILEKNVEIVSMNKTNFKKIDILRSEIEKSLNQHRDYEAINR